MSERTDQTVYWLWLQKKLGCGAKISKALHCFESPKAFWLADEAAYRQSECFGKLRAFSENGLPQLLDKSLDSCIETMQLCLQKHITILTPDDPRYPDKLRLLPDLPAALYIRGNADCLSREPQFAVIGSREPTQYALEAATEIAGVLAENDAVIVSGGAIGIDAAAHEAALQHQKPTLLVMGSGHGSAYLPIHSDLRRRVASCGALVTEYPPYTDPGRGSFQLRNRLISGLSDAVIIIQASENSGSLNTASHAKAQGRDLFVLPGSRGSKAFAGSNRLLVEGANTVINGEDVFAHYGIDVKTSASPADPQEGEPFADLQQQEQNLPLKKKPNRTRHPASAPVEKPHTEAKKDAAQKNIFIFAPESVSKNAQIVYNILQTQPAALDTIVRESGMTVPQVLASLTELELSGAVTRDERAFYTCL